jgi:hypothetical protein
MHDDGNFVFFIPCVSVKLKYRILHGSWTKSGPKVRARWPFTWPAMNSRNKILQVRVLHTHITMSEAFRPTDIPTSHCQASIYPALRVLSNMVSVEDHSFHLNTDDIIVSFLAGVLTCCCEHRVLETAVEVGIVSCFVFFFYVDDCLPFSCKDTRSYSCLLVCSYTYRTFGTYIHVHTCRSHGRVF